MARKAFPKELVQRMQYQILDEVESRWGKEPLGDPEHCATWPGGLDCFSTFDAARVERLQVYRARLNLRTAPVQAAGQMLLSGLEARLDAVRYAALEQMIYQNLLNSSEDTEEQEFLSFLLSNALRYPAEEVREFDDGLEGLAYLTGERTGAMPEGLRQRINAVFQVDLTPELLAQSTRMEWTREYQMQFGHYPAREGLDGKFDLWNFLTHGYDQSFDALLGEREKGMERIRIDGVSLSECMEGKLENLTGEEEDKLKKLVLCAAVLSRHTKVVCRVPDGLGGERDVSIRPGDGTQIEPESLDRFLRQFQPCFVKERETPELSANNVLVREKKGPTPHR